LLRTLPDDERAAIESHLAEYDRQTEALRLVERGIAEVALDGENVKRLMTIPGIDMVVAIGVMAAIGRIDRFACPDKLVAYPGLNPSVRQSGDGPARHGRISKRGRSHARHLLVEAAWQTVRSPGLMRAFYERVKGRRETHVAALAVARKLAVLIWHILTMEEDCALERPTLMARKLRSLELAARKSARHGRRGSAYDCDLLERRRAGREHVEQSERAYRRLTERWRRHGIQRGAGAASEERP
jgi:transposase